MALAFCYAHITSVANLRLKELLNRCIKRLRVCVQSSRRLDTEKYPKLQQFVKAFTSKHSRSAVLSLRAKAAIATSKGQVVSDDSQ